MPQSAEKPWENRLKYWPINIRLEGRYCLVVGGGEVGQRKVLSLLEAGARVGLVARDISFDLKQLVDEARVEYLDSEYRPEFLDGALLVFAATNDEALNRRIASEAEAQNILVNVADRPDLCSFTVPASINRGDLTITVSTDGQSPALARRIRMRLEELFGPEYEPFLQLLGLIRRRVLMEGGSSKENKVLFRQVVESDILRHLAREDLKQAEESLLRIMGPGYTFEALGFTSDKEAAI